MAVATPGVQLPCQVDDELRGGGMGRGTSNAHFKYLGPIRSNLIGVVGAGVGIGAGVGAGMG